MLDAIADIVSRGGWIMYPLMGVSLIVWFMGLYKIYQVNSFCRVSKLYKSEFKNILSGKKKIKTDEPCHDYLLSRMNLPDCQAVCLENVIEEFALKTGFFLNQGLDTMKVLISVAPLLGLLGTVVGMIKTFDLITLFGAGNPSITADGISVALLTTEAGLIVALPGLLLHNFISVRIAKVNRAVSMEYYRLIKLNGNEIATESLHRE
ncbi:MAG: MotA/TolQ/ExbB proton channel family protein [Fibrobacter sp.]|nr:MotA/TolQ/ExbB proton channel family protein [Fibrobacter sp.]